LCSLAFRNKQPRAWHFEFRNKQPVEAKMELGINVVWNLNATAIEFKVERQSWRIQCEAVLMGKGSQQLEM
jgi:hypothetical protein